ncbi:MAG: hypothetical protein II822_10465 [Prevotella sp.]|nr:hypothetical protein [Prevotella sp.]
MSKTKDAAIDAQQEQNNLLDELLKNGTATVTGDSRQSVYDQGDALVATIPADVKWTRTIVVCDNDTLVFSQTYSLIKD